MKPIRNLDVEAPREADVDRAEELLLEITDDARRLENRYLKETIVPEGGE
ncbi:MAG TPA: hypothetical protein VLK65_16285 [Vicinamibacteria bacterium]|nr:hypothetical protein [Vicinamibacteria bacterium]